MAPLRPGALRGPSTPPFGDACRRGRAPPAPLGPCGSSYSARAVARASR